MVMTAAVLFGLNGSLSRLLFDDGITPLTLIEFRMLIGGLCLMTVLVIGQRKGLKVKRRYWGWIIAFGISLAFTTYTYLLSISRLPIAVALIIIFTAAAWMALWEAIWHKHMPSKHVLVALGLTLGGVILLTGVWHEKLIGLDPLGLLFAFLWYHCLYYLSRAWTSSWPICTIHHRDRLWSACGLPFLVYFSASLGYSCQYLDPLSSILDSSGRYFRYGYSIFSYFRLVTAY